MAQVWSIEALEEHDGMQNVHDIIDSSYLDSKSILELK